MKPQKPAAAAKPTDPREEWKKVCESSNGTRIMLTGDLEKEALAYQQKHQEFEKLSREFAKSTAIFNRLTDEHFFNLRKATEEAGTVDNPWEKDFGYDQAAKKDGVMVINIH